MTKVRRIRVCFISDKLMAYTSVFRDRIGIIAGLDPRYFEVWVAVWSPIEKLERSMVVQQFLGPIQKNNGLFVYIVMTYNITNALYLSMNLI